MIDDWDDVINDVVKQSMIWALENDAELAKDLALANLDEIARLKAQVKVLQTELDTPSAAITQLKQAAERRTAQRDEALAELDRVNALLRASESMLRAVEDSVSDPRRAIIKADRLAGQAMIEAHAAKAKYPEIWDECAEAYSEWMWNNPGPSGVPSDPPRNPYE